MKKSVYKRPWFWIFLTLFLILFLALFPTGVALFQFHIYAPAIDPTPEEFLILSDESEIEFEEFKKIPSGEIQIIPTSNGGKRVENRHDEYTLTLPQGFEPDIRGIKQDEVSVKSGTCAFSFDNVTISAKDSGASDGNSATTVAEWIEKEKRDGIYAEHESIRSFERISNVRAEAYNLYTDGPFCTPGQTVFIQGKNRVFFLTDPSCNFKACSLELETILNNFHPFIPDEKVDG